VSLSLLTALVAFLAFEWHSCNQLPVEILNTLTSAIKPEITIETSIQTSIQRFHEQGKLVVYSAEINVDLSKESEKRILWGYVNLGTTSIHLRSFGNKVQYKIPLEEITQANFKWDPISRMLTLILPPPEVDQDLVEVQTDPSKIEIERSIGWARLNSNSGKFVEEEANRELRSAVLQEANNPRYLQAAEQSASERVRAFVETVHPAHSKLVIHFKPPTSSK
jgi:hypothetical protein